MKNKLLIVLLMIFLLSFSGCTNQTSTTTKGFISQADDFSYYKDLQMTKDGVLYVYGLEKVYSFEEIFLGEAIQGLFSRDNSKYYYLSSTNDSYAKYLDDMVSRYPLTKESTTLNDMIVDYIATYQQSGYVLYDRASNPESVNVASSIAGVYGYLPIDVSIEEYAKSQGLTKALDVTDKDEIWCFNELKDQLDNTGLIQQNPNTPHLRDYGIACKYFFFYPDGSDTKTILFRGEVHQWAKDDTPIFGWGPDSEDIHVSISSSNGQFTLASDYAYNLSVFSCRDFFLNSNLSQKNHATGVVAENGKHYVTFVRSDGDNVQTWTNSAFNFNPKDLGSERGDFPMGWSMQVSLIDLAPSIISYTYENADVNDYFVCAVSGQGYIYPQNYPSLEHFTSALSMYLRKTDMSVVSILDNGVSEEVIEAYSLIPELAGGMYFSGDRYAGLHGSIYWSANGKPFVSCRESLWNEDIVALADRINHYAKDPSSIEGYTLVNLHPWSMSYQDVQKLVALLDDDVVIVSPEDFIQLITDNVPHENVILS